MMIRRWSKLRDRYVSLHSIGGLRDRNPSFNAQQVFYQMKRLARAEYFLTRILREYKANKEDGFASDFEEYILDEMAILRADNDRLRRQIAFYTRKPSVNIDIRLRRNVLKIQVEKLSKLSYFYRKLSED